MSSRGTDHLGGGREVLSATRRRQNRVIPGFVGNAVDDVGGSADGVVINGGAGWGDGAVRNAPIGYIVPSPNGRYLLASTLGRRRVAQAVGRRRRASRQVVRGAAGIAILRLRRLRRRGRDVVRGVRVGGRVGDGVGSAHRGGGAEDPRVGRGVAKRATRRESGARRGDGRRPRGGEEGGDGADGEGGATGSPGTPGRDEEDGDAGNGERRARRGEGRGEGGRY